MHYVISCQHVVGVPTQVTFYGERPGDRGNSFGFGLEKAIQFINYGHALDALWSTKRQNGNVYSILKRNSESGLYSAVYCQIC